LDITGVEWRVKTRINWLGVAYSNGLLWKWRWIFRFHGTLGRHN
jgi:hypothetical protein